MKKTALLFLMLLTGLGFASGQGTDSLIYAEGKIVNAATKEPISAKITYQSLPYGARVGLLNGSSYSFPLYDNEKYSILVEANGFAPSKYMLDPAAANTDKKVIKDIELGLPGSASNVAPVTHTVGKVMRLDALNFEVGSATILAESHPELDQLAKMLHDNPHMVIQLEGHTDVKGDPSANLKLSQQRVDAAKNYLITKGVAKARVKTKAFGGTQPLSRENTEAAHKLNRRVEVRILEN
jgi:OmpA-OmpF porin, OOP family